MLVLGMLMSVVGFMTAVGTFAAAICFAVSETGLRILSDPWRMFALLMVVACLMLAGIGLATVGTFVAGGA